jgi:hypothetical protein
MIQTATMPLCHISRWRSGAFLRMPLFNVTLWRCGILTLLAAAVNRLTVQKLGNQYYHLFAGWAQRIKKTPPPSPCGRPVYVPTISSETDTRTIDQAVGSETDPNI